MDEIPDGVRKATQNPTPAIPQNQPPVSFGWGTMDGKHESSSQPSQFQSIPQLDSDALPALNLSWIDAELDPSKRFESPVYSPGFDSP